MRKNISILILLIIAILVALPLSYVKAINSEEMPELPSKYNLADEINIKVESQGSYGNCWNFASLKSLETYLQLHGYGEYDFSELHLDYIESTEFGNSYRNIHEGGRFEWQFIHYLENKLGPVLEEEMPYNKEYTIDDYEYLLNLTPKVYVGEIIDFERVNKVNYEYTEEELQEFRNEVKQHIMKNGAIYASIVSPKEADNYYNKETFAEYIPNNTEKFYDMSHAISIIGWDDNYSRDNFSAYSRPDRDGAYIALNSWGASWGDKGVLYISYEDIYVEQEMYGIGFATTNKDEVSRLKINGYGETETIKLEDVNLYNALKTQIYQKIISYDDAELTLEVNKDAIEEITDLNFRNKRITNIKGIEKFTNLQNIDLSENKIMDATPLENLHLIKDLSIADNKLTEFNIPKSEMINYIDVSNNGITRITGLDKLTKNTTIDMSNTLIDLAKLKEIKEIGTLKLNNSKLRDEAIENIKHIKFSENGELQLKNNYLVNVSQLGKINTIDLSGNRNIDVTTIPETNKLFLRDCNITSAKGITTSVLDLSGNKDIDISTIPEVDELYLQDCKISNIYRLTLPKRVLDLSNNPFTEWSLYKLKSSQIEKLNLSATYIEDVSKLKDVVTLRELDLSKNKDLKNIQVLEQVNILNLENCNINSIEPLLNLKELTDLNLSHNNIEYYEGLLYLEKLKRIDLSYNIAKDVYTYYGDKKYVNLDNNKIEKVRKSEYVSSIKKQVLELNIEIERGKENKFTDLGETLKRIYQNRYKEKMKILLENCQIDYTTGEFILKSNESSGIATIKVEGGTYDGYYCKINYITKDKIEPTGIKIIRNANKNNYIIGSQFDNTGLIVRLIYPNGSSEEITDYEIINGDNLQPNGNPIIIKYGDFQAQYNGSIKLYNGNQIVLAKLYDENLFNEISRHYGVNSNILIDSNEETNEIKLNKEMLNCTVDELTINNAKNIIGISNMYNLYYITLNCGEVSNLEELTEIEELREIEIYNNNKIEDINTLAGCKKLSSIKLVNTSISKFDDIYERDNLKRFTIQNTVNDTDLRIEDNVIILPDYIKYLQDQGCTLTAYITYINKDEKYLNSTTIERIEVSDGENLSVPLKKGINGFITIEIKGDKISEYDTSYLKINYTLEEDKQIELDKDITVVDENMLLMDMNTTVDKLKSSFRNAKEIKIYSTDNKEVLGEEKLATGMVVKIGEEIKYKVVVICDLNGDGRLSAQDLSLMQLYLVQLQALQNEYEKASDINQDGKITILDLSKICQKIVEMS